MAGRRHGRLPGGIAAVLAAALLAGCGASTTPVPTPALTPVATQAATPAPALGPTPESTALGPTPEPTAIPTPEPTPTPTPELMPSPTPELMRSPTPNLPDALILTPEGLAGAKLGDEPGTAIGAIAAVLGSPSLDGDWQDSFSTYGTCPGTQIRPVGWGPLLFLFTDGTSAFAKAPRPHLFEIRYSDLYTGEAHTTLPIPVTTQLGITLGSTKADIKAAYGANVEFEPGNEALAPVFHVGPFGPGGIYGFLDETNDAATVFELGSGQLCGE